MKCPICGAENPPDADSCQGCGFSLSLSTVDWPEFPSIDLSSLSSEPPGQDEVEEPRAPEQDAPSTGEPTDDEMAREHIARGFEAIREDMPDQARWELEQARDLADDEKIAHMAQGQLAALAEEEFSTPDPIPPPSPPAAPRPAVPPAPRTAVPAPTVAGEVKAADWGFAFKTGVTAGLVSAVIAGCGTVTCLGLFVPPLAGLVAGLAIASRKNEAGQSPDAIHALLAGCIAGLGGWLGQIISRPGPSTSAETNSTQLAWPILVCLIGAVYVPLASGLGVLGWKIGRSNRE